MIRSVLACTLACVIAMTAPGTRADTVTVTIVTDDVDFGGARMINDLPGPDGEVSLSEAFLATNNTPGHDRIEFAITLGAGQTVARFTSITGFYWRTTDAVTIDGTSQTDFGGDTNPTGREVEAMQWPVYVLADESEIRGFHNTEISVAGGTSALIEDNTGTSGTANYEIGSGCTVRNNSGNTIRLNGSSNVVVGNHFDRIRVWGGTGNRIGGPDPADRNIIRGYGWVNSEGLPAGAAIELVNTTDVLVESNWIGTTDGLTQGNTACTMGIDFSGTNTGAVVRDNLIAGVLGRGQGPHHHGQLFGWAIYMEGTADDISIVGNTIGLDINGQPTLGAVTGVSLGTWATQSLTNIRVGGPNPGDGNIIAGQIWNGIVVDEDIKEVRISGNAIWGNGQIGIDLLPLGVTPNDPLDVDDGGNGLQNFPELTTAVADGSTMNVTGELHSSPSTQFTVEFFASSECDPTDFGPGQVYLGATTVTTDGAGDAAIDVQLPVAEEGWLVTSTATREPVGATSEFSACVVIEGNVVSTPEDGGTGPRVWALHGSPNPFRASTTVLFELTGEDHVQLEIFDAGGRRVRALVDARITAGAHSVAWDGRDDAGRDMESGVYFAELVAGSERLVQKLHLLR